MSVKVTIVIIHFNSDKHIEKCIDCIIHQNGVSPEIIVVDNASTNNLQTLLTEKYPRLQYIRQEKNTGAAFANNLGIERSSAEFVCILNADVFLDDQYLAECIGFLVKNPDVSEAQGLLVSDRNEQIIDSAGVNFFGNGFAIDRHFGDDIKIFDEQFERAISIDGTCCAAAVYRRQHLIAVKNQFGYFNNILFAFYEDFELSARLRSIDTKAYLLLDATGKHVRGGSVVKHSSFVKFLHLRNLLLINLYIFRHDIRSKFFSHFYLFLLIIKNLSLVPRLYGFFKNLTKEEINAFPQYRYASKRSYLKQKLKAPIR